MLDYLDRRNRKPAPFVWKADADLIFGKIQRLCTRLLTQDTGTSLSNNYIVGVSLI